MSSYVILTVHALMTGQINESTKLSMFDQLPDAVILC